MGHISLQGTRRGNGTEAAGHGSFMLLELKEKVWRVGGGAGEADRGGWIEEGA